MVEIGGYLLIILFWAIPLCIGLGIMVRRNVEKQYVYLFAMGFTILYVVGLFALSFLD
jgi:uncharacterized membrane protein